MNIVLLSGGSGTRLWPLSNDIRSKQFLKVFRKDATNKESMAQRMFRMINEAESDSNVIIATSECQVPIIHSQIGDHVSISIEPCRRDTFPAIVLACAKMAKNMDRNQPVIVCPVDSYIDDDYFVKLRELQSVADQGVYNLVLLGIEPDSPSNKFGYIIPKTNDEVSDVLEFKEKPNIENARDYIREGALWNGGVFAFKLEYVLDIAEETFGTSNYDKLLEEYEKLPKISFDYAVVEKEEKIGVVRYEGSWQDLGTWNALTGIMEEETAGQVQTVDCNNTHVVNELGMPLIAMGLEDTVVVATYDGILVANKDISDSIKDYAKRVVTRPMYEKRAWGKYRVLDYVMKEDVISSLVKELEITGGRHISYQVHRHRMEMWTVVEGTGRLILDGVVSEVSRGDTVTIGKGMRHGIEAINELHIIEVQLGEELTEEDIERLEWPIGE